LATNIFPSLSYLSGASSGSFVVPTTTAAIKASGVHAEVEASNDDVKAQRVVAESYPNNSPVFSVVCCTTIPPSPAVVEPEANSANLSAINKFSCSWKDAVPCTVKSPLMIISSWNVLSPIIVSAKPIVYEGAPPKACAAVPVISISPVVCVNVISVLPSTAVPAVEP